MLILSRKIGEAIVVGDDVTIRIVDIKGKNVRLGVDAPRQKAIHREEVFRKIQEANRAAAEAAAAALNLDEIDTLLGKITS